MLQDLDHGSEKLASVGPEDPLAPNGAVRWISSELPLAPSEAVRWNESSGQQDLNDAKTSHQPLTPSHFSMDQVTLERDLFLALGSAS